MVSFEFHDLLGEDLGHTPLVDLPKWLVQSSPQLHAHFHDGALHAATSGNTQSNRPRQEHLTDKPGPALALDLLCPEQRSGAIPANCLPPLCCQALAITRT